MKMFYMAGLRRRASQPVDMETMAAWRRDPLSHPALRHMDERELADLPLARLRFAAQTCEETPGAC